MKKKYKILLWAEGIIAIIKICNLIKQNGGTAYLVGGYVRDRLLGIESKDIDIEVFGIEYPKLKELLSTLGAIKEVGKSFGVIKLDNIDISLPRRERKSGRGHKGFDITFDPHMYIDISLPRRERKSGRGHKGFDITFDPHMSTKDAARRRDLTINSIMYDPLQNSYRDHFNGKFDLEWGIIRHIDDKSFAEDPLRILRIAQFMSRFQFSVHPMTSELCKSLLCELKDLPKERIFEELTKLLMRGVKPSLGFNWLLDIGALEILFPELYDIVGVEQGTKHHAEGDVWTHTMMAMDTVPLEERELHIMLAILLHDTGKALIESAVDENDPTHIKFRNHEKEGVKSAESFMNRITNNKKLIESILPLVRHHMRPYSMIKELKKKTLRRLSLKANIPDMIKVHIADKSGRLKVDINQEAIDNILHKYNEIKDEVKPLIKGRHLIELGHEPSDIFGVWLKEIFGHQLDGEFTTLDEGLEWLRRSEYNIRGN
jgi:tRNA nucleotidyltransferase (CCA-adding enzyme)